LRNNYIYVNSSTLCGCYVGIISNNNQTATLLDNQRALSEAMRNSMERNVQGLSVLINLDSDRTINIMDRNNAFANQNLNSITSSLKDLIQHGFTNDQTAIERTSAANIGTIDRVGNSLSSAIERNGSMNMNTTERTSGANAIAMERIGGQLLSLSERNNREIMEGFKESQLTSEKNFGETRLFNATQHQNIERNVANNTLQAEKNFGESRLFSSGLNQQLERQVGNYHLQSERNFGKIENDLSRVENSIGRLIDNHHNLTMMEMLKMHSSLDKSISNSELAIIKQAADNYAATQIEAAKNKMAIEQKILETSSDIKLSNIKDNNDTRSLINSYNNDNMRFDLQSEKIIHALHHHGHHNGYHNDHYGHHIPHHNHYYNNYEGRRGGSGD